MGPLICWHCAVVDSILSDNSVLQLRKIVVDSIRAGKE